MSIVLYVLLEYLNKNIKVSELIKGSKYQPDSSMSYRYCVLFTDLQSLCTNSSAQQLKGS